MTQGSLQIGLAAPDPDEVLEALKRDVRHDHGARDRKAEDLSKDFDRSGYLHEEPDPMLGGYDGQVTRTKRSKR